MPSGLLFIDKEEGVTSRYVDNALQRLFHTRKVGHLGTLDPFATGLLIVAVGEATKYLPYLPDEEKSYLATLALGVKTDTGDKTGIEIKKKEVPALAHEAVKKVLSSFLGASKQVPPMTSAIKKDGVALYKLARQGKEIERESRDIHIHKIELIHLEENSFTFLATVSKGTYIRALGEDIASKLGTVGHLTALRRIAIGPVDLTRSLPLSKTTEEAFLKPEDFVFYPRVEVTGEEEKKARNGVPLSFSHDEERLLVMCQGKALAIYEKDGGVYRCRRGL